MQKCEFNTCRNANSTHEGMRKSPFAHVGITFQTVYFNAFFQYKFTKSSNVILTIFKLWCIHYPCSNVKIASICVILAFLFSVCMIRKSQKNLSCDRGSDRIPNYQKRLLHIFLIFITVEIYFKFVEINIFVDTFCLWPNSSIKFSKYMNCLSQLEIIQP